MNESLQKHSSVFWIEVDKIKPNPMQPRSEFDKGRLLDLSESIRQYGVLQPLVVTRKEAEGPNGIVVEYELIAGERRWRASRMAGLKQVPVIIRKDTEDKIKLELAIIENLQREDLNPLERARAFKKLIETFNLKHHEVARRVGKSRVFVTNSLRLLNLPEEIQRGLREGLISEGHMRPILMLSGRNEEQFKLYKEILEKKLNVRQSEAISRRIATEKARKREGSLLDMETKNIEEKLSEMLGTRVQIEKTGKKGKIHIDFFSEEELRSFLGKIAGEENEENLEVDEEIQDETGGDSGFQEAEEAEPKSINIPIFAVEADGDYPEDKEKDVDVEEKEKPFILKVKEEEDEETVGSKEEKSIDFRTIRIPVIADESVAEYEIGETENREDIKTGLPDAMIEKEDLPDKEKDGDEQGAEKESEEENKKIESDEIEEADGTEPERGKEKVSRGLSWLNGLLEEYEPDEPETNKEYREENADSGDKNPIALGNLPEEKSPLSSDSNSADNKNENDFIKNFSL